MEEVIGGEECKGVISKEKGWHRGLGGGEGGRQTKFGWDFSTIVSVLDLPDINLIING